MLVITRKPGEKIILNDDVTITLLEIDRGKVRIGVQAPPEVSIYREEIYKLIRAGVPKKTEQKGE